MTLSVEAAREYIESIDFTPIIGRLIKQGWKKQQALEASNLYKRFLFLKKRYEEQFQIIPSEEIDEVWHLHILYTKKYHQDCEKIFGKYLHHEPELESNTTLFTDNSNSKQIFEETQRLYHHEYGEYIPAIKAPFLLSRLIISIIGILNFKKFLPRTENDYSQ